jgi:glutamine synthetase
MTRSHRQNSIRLISDRPQPNMSLSDNWELTSEFGQDVFSDDVMKRLLPKEAYGDLRKTIDEGSKLHPATAEAVANAMRSWAQERGATHFTHWFQPMTGLTAEKHDSFLDFSKGKAILKFDGSQLVQGEPDASSFPSGGIRATFEARGYTAWDPSSPAFLRRDPNGCTLCIPTAFCSYTGEALDEKTPLMRSGAVLGKEGVRIAKLLGHENVDRVFATVGLEQEYFLLDKQFFVQRPDLGTTGRTLFGAPPLKGHELDDHYFGAIRKRVMAFMQDLDRELWRLGVPAKTRHNEVAPSQFELAPIFEPTNVSVDHNMITMEVLRNVADAHGFTCLLHEKPYAGINGSGKHTNWSIACSRRGNLLEPGATPHANIEFLFHLAATIAAVDRHADLLRASIAHAGNDHRLGANEAPPAIISVYLGDQLSAIVEAICSGTSLTDTHGGMMHLGVDALPQLTKDPTDRNRTSPFAFTGNKFEFRAAGSGQNVAVVNTVLNSVAADALRRMGDQLEELVRTGKDHLEAVEQVIRETLQAHQRVCFSGDGYGQEWQEEAERRGLNNLRTTPDALPAWITPEAIELFGELEVLSERELRARHEIACEKYNANIAIEGATAEHIAKTMVLPAVIAYQRRIGDAIVASMAAGLDASQLQTHSTLLGDLANLANSIDRGCTALSTGLASASAVDNPAAGTVAYRDEVLAAQDSLRESVDAAELIVEDRLWPLPKYHEMLAIY